MIVRQAGAREGLLEAQEQPEQPFTKGPTSAVPRIPHHSGSLCFCVWSSEEKGQAFLLGGKGATGHQEPGQAHTASKLDGDLGWSSELISLEVWEFGETVTGELWNYCLDTVLHWHLCAWCCSNPVSSAFSLVTFSVTLPTMLCVWYCREKGEGKDASWLLSA